MLCPVPPPRRAVLCSGSEGASGQPPAAGLRGGLPGSRRDPVACQRAAKARPVGTWELGLGGGATSWDLGAASARGQRARCQRGWGGAEKQLGLPWAGKEQVALLGAACRQPAAAAAPCRVPLQEPGRLAAVQALQLSLGPSGSRAPGGGARTASVRVPLLWTSAGPCGSVRPPRKRPSASRLVLPKWDGAGQGWHGTYGDVP